MNILSSPRHRLAHTANVKLEELGLSVEDFGTAMGVGRTARKSLLRGNNYFPLEKCQQYVQLLGVDPADAARLHLAQYHPAAGIEFVERAFRGEVNERKEAWWQIVNRASFGRPRMPKESDVDIMRVLLRGNR